MDSTQIASDMVQGSQPHLLQRRDAFLPDVVQGGAGRLRPLSYAIII
ncbi:MAG: hypothetical protein R2838_03275 [Caldilineaceae bacterium]